MSVTEGTETPRPGLGPVTADELIDDRALESPDDDKFRLTDFVAELAQRCRVARTPANIALYGAWGSGKTSLGNLLEATFKNDPKIAFGRFDAFKFAEVPLRRHFLASVASWFGIEKSDYSEDLYKETKEQNFKITARNAAALGGAILLAVVCLTLVMGLAAVIIAALARHSATFGKTFVATMRASAPGILISAPIVGAVLAMAFDRFKVETTTSAPFSDEEFEKRFKALVGDIKKETRKERVLIFIDELDRCSPKQVGSVLETLRTFLDVESCVFVVAADQQVLEHALMEGGARQATPSDGANPYYSSGSAYLDKIFHQQIPLPPLLPRTLSQFALRLVETRNGVWERVPNQAELISVLVPTHVRSPRRVKTLLNTFSSLYRLAILRAEDGALDSDVEIRASEVGKLVCLRTEFPLFARDLSLDARLPEIVLALHGKPTMKLEDLRISGVPPEIFERARAYAAGRLPVADLLSYTSEAASAAPPAPAPDKNTDPEEPDPEEEVEPGTTGVNGNVQRTYARLLIRYLQRTQAIPGPRRDLIYLESSGRAFGLPAEFADRLEDDARDGQAAQVAEQISALGPPDQLAACRLLAQLIVEGSVGLETRNVVKSLFAATAVTEPLNSVADELLAALANYASSYHLDAEDLGGALQLALSSDSPAARTMRTNLLSRDEVITDEDLGMAVLEGAERILPSSSGRLSAVLAARLSDTSAEVVLERLGTIRDEAVVRLVAGIPKPEEKEGDEDPSTLESDLCEFADAALDAARPLIATAAFDRLLALNTTDARTQASKILPKLAPIADQKRCRAVMGAAQRRVLQEWPVWLSSLAPGSLKASVQADRAALTAALKKIWSERFAPAGTQPTPPTADDAVAAMRALAAVADELPLDDFDPVETLRSTQPSPVTPEAQIAMRSEQHATLSAFVEAGLLLEAEFAHAVLDDLGETLVAAIPPEQAEPFVAWISEACPRALRSAGADFVNEFIESVEASPWLDSETAKSIRLLAAAAARVEDESVAPPLAAAEIADLLATGTGLVDEAASQWIEAFRPGAQKIVEALREHASAGRLTGRMRQALGRLGDSWGAGEKAALLESVAAGFVAGSDSDALLRDLRLGGAEPNRVSGVLVGLLKNAGNNNERERVLQLWGMAQPSSQKARQALVDGVFLPLINGGKGQARLALDHFVLVSASVGKPTQDKIKKALYVAAADDKDLQKRVNRVLQDAGWIKRPRRFRIPIGRK